MKIFPTNLEMKYTIIIFSFFAGIGLSLLLIPEICNFTTKFTSNDFENWFVGIGTLFIGVGTLGLAYAALKTIPEKLTQRYKDKELIKLYQKVVYRMYRDVEASSEGITYSLPEDVEQLTKLLIKRYPQIGSKEDADRLMDDLMLDDYFQHVAGNTTVLKTSKWDPRDRTKKVKPKIDTLPGDNK